MRQAKRAERLIPIARLLVLGGLLSFVGFYLSSQFWVIFLFTLLVNFVYPTLLPLSDAVAARMVIQVNLDYGNVRLWGSAAFIVGATLIGFVI
jgi:PPP family 3-phenylpropionic acid transporter